MACRPAMPSRSGLAAVSRSAVAGRAGSPSPRAESLSAGARSALSAAPVARTALLCAQSVQLARGECVEPLDRADQQSALWASLAPTLTEECRLALVALQCATGCS